MIRNLTLGKASEETKDKIKGIFFLISLLLVLFGTVFGVFSLVYLDNKEDWTYYEVTVQGETYECDAYRLSDEDIVLYRDYYTSFPLDDNVSPYKTIEISDKSEVEIKELKSEDYKTFGGWLKDFFAFSDVEWGR